ncbi:DsbA family protein [Cribrihabitans neustonicus]|uniref:DsbA family protein n=1 Tax=Cribrihabitans neustonicus TaxID=1429085 RepID=UPI003B59A9FC
MKRAALALSLAALPTLAPAAELSEEEIKQLVYEAIMERPEIIMQAVEKLQRSEAAAQDAAVQSVLAENRDMLERDANAPVLGNPEGDVTVVEFFDYNCPYCRRAMPHVQGLIEEDENVRVVYREWPILGEGSVFAARAALAARKQGKYEAFHWALMGMDGRASEATVMRAAQEVGLDTEQLRRDMEAPEVEEHIATSMELAGALGFNGTPSFVIGDSLAPGLAEQSQLQQLVDEARSAAE